MKVSPEVKVSVKKFANVTGTSCNQNSVFDSLSRTSSQKGKNIYRSPWKFKQGLKRTGLLQKSSRNLSVVMKVWRKQTAQSLGSTSNSLAISGTGAPSPPSNIEELSQQNYDHIIYRHSKGYYLENFLRSLDTVLSQPQDLKLLNDDDLEVIKTFKDLSLSAQKLYVRLFQRKIKWNRVLKIEYRDICDKEDTKLYVNELGSAKFVHQENELVNLEEILLLLTCEELRGLCKQMKMSTTGKKEDLVSSLLKCTEQKPTLLERAIAIIGRCCLVRKIIRQVFMRVLILYGLPCYDDDDEEGGQQSHLTTLLMVSADKMKFPKYDIIRNHSIFQSRGDLLRFEAYLEILADVQECMDGKRWDIALQHCELAKTAYQDLLRNKELMDHDQSLPRFLRRFTSASLLVYILTRSVECYQRTKRYQKAVDQLQELLDQKTYLMDYHGCWYERLALNLEVHVKKRKLALEVIGKALNDPLVRKGHRLSLSMRAKRMAATARCKNLAPMIAKIPLMSPKEAPRVMIEGYTIRADNPGCKRLFIQQDSEQCAEKSQVKACSVEELALGHYKKQGYSEGLHREGTTVNTLFGIYFWDILYASLPDVFRSPHQAAPLDLDDASFYMARKEKIDHRLAELRYWTEEAAVAELERVWNDHSGEVSLVSWSLFRSVNHAQGLVICMGLPVLAAICERLAKDHRFTCSGFPDLVVWDLNTKRCRIVEVKGPRDRLSTKQILWLDYLLTCGATAEVCHVVDVGAKTMKRTSFEKVSAKKASPKKSKNNDTTDSEEIMENKRERKRLKKKIKANNRSVKDKKWRIKNINDTTNDDTDSDSSWEEKIIKRKIRGGYEEPRKIITRSMKIENLKNSDCNEK